MKTVQRVLAGTLILLSVSIGSASAQSNFALDVNDAIDDALNFMRSTYWGAAPTFVPSVNEASGMIGLALLEKRQSANPGDPIVGYQFAGANDQARLRNLVAALDATSTTSPATRFTPTLTAPTSSSSRSTSAPAAPRSTTAWATPAARCGR